MGYVLEPNEGILLQVTDSGPIGELDYYCTRVLLTNKYIVFMNADDADEDEYVIDKIDLRDIRIFQNTPQMFITDGSTGPQLDIYLKDMTVNLVFGCYFSSKKLVEAYNQWIDTIKSILIDESAADREQSPGLKRFCGNCGEKITSDGNFCKYCGAKL